MPLNPNTLQALNAAVLSDTLDSLGLMQQAMKPFMRPLDDTLQRGDQLADVFRRLGIL